MFTGIIQHVGTVHEVQTTPAGKRLRVDAGRWSHSPCAGESIAINGCCLTLVHDGSHSDPLLDFDVVPETLARSTIGALAPGSPVNIEHAATPTTLMGGHIVQGHIDAVGRVLAINADHSSHVLHVEVTGEPAQAITPKGSVALEGVSLTVASVRESAISGGWEFSVALIPTTVRETTLGSLRVGDAVNIETDILARTVVHWLRQFGGHSSDRPRL